MGLAGWIIAILALLLAVCAGALIVYKRNLLKVRRSLENLRLSIMASGISAFMPPTTCAPP